MSTTNSLSSTPTTVNTHTLSKQEPQQPSIFLKKKKPTVASIGSKPLLRPFRNNFIDYNNPSNNNDPIPLRTTKGTVIPLPGSSPSINQTEEILVVVQDKVTKGSNSSSSSSSPASSISSSHFKFPTNAPFTFDNHTSESKTLNKASNPSKLQPGGDTSNGANADAVTILRIKRKRYEEPLDTLVVEEQLDKLAGKKQKKIEDSIQQERVNAQVGQISLPKPPPTVFRLATTVNKESFKDPTQSIQLRDKITHLTENKRPRSRLSERIIDLESNAQKNRAELTEKMQKDARSARFRVINQNRTGLNRPPEVKSSVQVEAEAALDVFKMYDAVREDNLKSKKQITPKDEVESDIMCNFLPMVREYLSISETNPSPVITKQLETRERSSTPLSRKTFDSDSDYGDSEDEYVYDIYYRDIHADQQETKSRSAVLLWFSDDENFLNEDDSSEDDYEDSDSNAEDYYQNDYPEDELSEDDNPYELSDTDDDEYRY